MGMTSLFQPIQNATVYSYYAYWTQEELNNNLNECMIKLWMENSCDPCCFFLSTPNFQVNSLLIPEGGEIL